MFRSRGRVNKDRWNDMKIDIHFNLEFNIIAWKILCVLRSSFRSLKPNSDSEAGSGRALPTATST